MIPTPVVDHFLTDYERTGQFSGFPQMGIQWQKMESDALKRAYSMEAAQKGAWGSALCAASWVLDISCCVLYAVVAVGFDRNRLPTGVAGPGMLRALCQAIAQVRAFHAAVRSSHASALQPYCCQNCTRAATHCMQATSVAARGHQPLLPPVPPAGVLIRSINPTSAAAKVLKPDDVLMKFDGVEIACDGTVPFRTGERISFSYLISNKFVGDMAELQVLRGGEVQQLQIE